MSDDLGDKYRQAATEFERALERMAETARIYGAESEAFERAENEMRERLLRADALRDLVDFGVLGDDVKEALDLDDIDLDLDDVPDLPERTIADLLPEIAALGATLARVIPILQEWEDWYEDDEEGRGRVIEQAYQGLMEAEGAIHTSAAVLHLFMTGMPPPSELLSTEEDDE